MWVFEIDSFKFFFIIISQVQFFKKTPNSPHHIQQITKLMSLSNLTISSNHQVSSFSTTDQIHQKEKKNVVMHY